MYINLHKFTLNKREHLVPVKLSMKLFVKILCIYICISSMKEERAPIVPVKLSINPFFKVLIGEAFRVFTRSLIEN